MVYMPVTEPIESPETAPAGVSSGETPDQEVRINILILISCLECLLNKSN